MTSSIDAETRAKATAPQVSESVNGEPPGPAPALRLVPGLRVFAAVAVAAGIALGVADLAGHGRIHFVIPAATCFLLAGMATATLIVQSQLAATLQSVHAMLADRQEFYRRGHLEGWYRGYRMQEPEVSDPLLK